MTRASFRLPPRTLALAIAAAAFTAFASALPLGFVEWDDHYNFLNNPHYRGLGLAQLRWMLTSAWSGHWTPLTWLTLSADFTVWGRDPFGYHLTSLVLHAATAGVLSSAIAVLPSELLMVTFGVAVPTTFQFASTALTLRLLTSAVPAV